MMTMTHGGSDLGAVAAATTEVSSPEKPDAPSPIAPSIRRPERKEAMRPAPTPARTMKFETLSRRSSENWRLRAHEYADLSRASPAVRDPADSSIAVPARDMGIQKPV